MKLTIGRDEFLAAVRAAAQASTPKGVTPVFACVLLTAADGVLTAEATDGQLAVRATAAADVRDAGVGACVAADKLVRVLADADGGPVDVAADADGLTLRPAGGGRFRLPVTPSDTFPRAEPSPAGGVVLPAGELFRCLDRVLYAADRQEGTARWAVTGVLFEAAAGGLRCVATDTRRLAFAAWGERAADAASCILPGRAAKVMADLARDADGDAVVTVGANTVWAAAGRVTLSSRLVEGRFPPYRDILPKSHAAAVSVPAGEFLRRLKQAATLAEKGGERVQFAFAPGGLVMTTPGAGNGDATVPMALPGYAGPAAAVDLDPRFVRDFLTHCEPGWVLTVELSDAAKPVVIRAPGAAYWYLAMPLTDAA